MTKNFRCLRRVILNFHGYGALLVRSAYWMGKTLIQIIYSVAVNNTEKEVDDIYFEN